ncbi:hypothetical protein DYB35_009748 [Aphanomyces astaci]|uniref:Endonuclease/exonuclease/phosphatase domain-containing protein n=1 Tax=Aphanomyces astaci TaxID=112090 RepID=A0A397EUA4_APHAT|nr:hypothetical protein DYB26_016063 [Aphanomyces astaci]RHY97837.1 hypothetical protein DYB35_009748 [Aphanomyces astaci]RHZ01169.1 hypothetical protein DYB31_015400 [Aphanomyces astaci]
MFRRWCWLSRRLVSLLECDEDCVRWAVRSKELSVTGLQFHSLEVTKPRAIQLALGGFKGSIGDLVQYVNMRQAKERRAYSQSPPRGSPTSGEGRISLRVDQPVEGCEVTTHAFYRSSDGDIDDDDFRLKFSWSKSHSKRCCANKQCARIGNGEGNVVLLMATVDCAVCLRQGLSSDSARFCTLECFRSAWSTHRQMHANGTTKLRIGGADDLDRHKSVVQEAPVRPATERWSVLQAAKTYTPSTADVGHILRVECTPLFRTGEECGPPKYMETNIVLPCMHIHPYSLSHARLVPPMAPTRQMVPAIGKDERLTAARLRIHGGFRILSYNVLAEIYATRQMYPYCPMWALNWSFRKQLLQRELQLYNADILCLQEVQADHYKNHFLPMMTAWGYEGMFQKKTRESMGLEGKVDGCAMFYRSSR